MQSEQFQLHAEIEEHHWWFVARRRIMRTLVEEVVPGGSTVVDVGCGTGANIASLADRFQAIGIDASDEAVESARKRFPRAKFLHGQSPSALGADLSKARLISLMDVLEHVEDDFQLLSTWLSASSPGTYFLLTVPADMQLWSPHDETFGHYRRYDAQRFNQLWVGLPVRTLMISYYNRHLYAPVKWAREFSRWRGHSQGAAGTDFAIPPLGLNHVLTEAFAAESRRLTKLMRGQCSMGYGKGVSLIAVVRREEGLMGPRAKPAIVAADPYQAGVAAMAQA